MGYPGSKIDNNHSGMGFKGAVLRHGMANLGTVAGQADRQAVCIGMQLLCIKAAGLNGWEQKKKTGRIWLGWNLIVTHFPAHPRREVAEMGVTAGRVGLGTCLQGWGCGLPKPPDSQRVMRDRN